MDLHCRVGHYVLGRAEDVCVWSKCKSCDTIHYISVPACMHNQPMSGDRRSSSSNIPPFEISPILYITANGYFSRWDHLIVFSCVPRVRVDLVCTPYENFKCNAVMLLRLRS